MSTTLAPEFTSPVASVIARAAATAAELAVPHGSSDRDLRLAELKAVVDVFLNSHRTWKESQARLLTQDFEDAIRQMFDAFAFGDLPGECRDLASAVGGLQEEWQHYEATVTQLQPDPRESFWHAVADVAKQRKGAEPIEPRVLEPVKFLRENKVGDAQIALMYGHRDADGVMHGPFYRNGAIQHHLILKEAENPGSVVPEGWIHPDELKRIGAARTEGARKLARLQTKVAAAPPCRESIEELLQQGVSPKQTALMHSVPIETVLVAARTMGIPTEEQADYETLRRHNPRLPENDPSPFRNTTTGPVAPVASEFGSDGAEVAGDGDLLESGEPVEDIDDEDTQDTAEFESLTPEQLESEIIALAATGIPATEVARQLGCTVQKAAAVLREHKRSSGKVG